MKVRKTTWTLSFSSDGQPLVELSKAANRLLRAADAGQFSEILEIWGRVKAAAERGGACHDDLSLTNTLLQVALMGHRQGKEHEPLALSRLASITALRQMNSKPIQRKMKSGRISIRVPVPDTERRQVEHLAAGLRLSFSRPSLLHQEIARRVSTPKLPVSERRIRYILNGRGGKVRQ